MAPGGWECPAAPAAAAHPSPPLSPLRIAAAGVPELQAGPCLLRRGAPLAQRLCPLDQRHSLREQLLWPASGAGRGCGCAAAHRQRLAGSTEQCSLAAALQRRPVPTAAHPSRHLGNKQHRLSRQGCCSKEAAQPGYGCHMSVHKQEHDQARRRAGSPSRASRGGARASLLGATQRGCRAQLGSKKAGWGDPWVSTHLQALALLIAGPGQAAHIHVQHRQGALIQAPGQQPHACGNRKGPQLRACIGCRCVQFWKGAQEAGG